MDNITTPVMILPEAQRILGSGETLDSKHLVKCYQTALWVANENEELTALKETELAVAWRIANQQNVIQQINEDGKFVLDIQFNDLEGARTCEACKGAGERFKFVKKPIQVGCLKCKDVLINLNGKDLIIELDTITYAGKDVSTDPKYKRFLGKIVEECPSCGGSGKYLGMGDGTDKKKEVPCKSCRGRNVDGRSQVTQTISKCKTCRGKRLVKIPVISSIIKSTTICRKCSGKGYEYPAPESTPMNPVFTNALADKIKGL